MKELKAKWVDVATDLCYFCGGYVKLWKIPLPFGILHLRICPDCLPKFKRFLTALYGSSTR